MALPASSHKDKPVNSVDLASAPKSSRSHFAPPQGRSQVNQGSLPLANEPWSQPRDLPHTESFAQEPLGRRVQSTTESSFEYTNDGAQPFGQRETEAEYEHEVDWFHAGPTAKEGRSFTVGNVGTGGKLYLRPAAPQPERSMSPNLLLPYPQPSHDPLHPTENASSPASRYSMWSDFRPSSDQGKTQLDAPHRRAKQARSLSFATIDDTHKSLTGPKTGALRIVIDRPSGSQPRNLKPLPVSDLEFPASLHQQGIRGLSSEGMSVPGPSTHLGTSERTSKLGKSDRTPNADPPTNLELEAESVPRDLQTPGLPLQQATTTDVPARTSIHGTATPSKGSYPQAMSHQIFDNLARGTDDPRLVRYSSKTGAIAAATPARIVAQISSSTFMDYDLVSDFFLTFREYLSTDDLLDLLLARLSWSINRAEDDGRIIRIRTFAALRHWILNYFPDDFVLNRKLRVRFCDQINHLYSQVNKRSGGGRSDLKILQDLKRCWNGRCSLYWDWTEAALDTQQEGDIVPGGIHGSRDPTRLNLECEQDHHPASLRETRQDIGVARPGHQRPSTANCPTIRPRQASRPSKESAVSPPAQQSFQASSAFPINRATKQSASPEASTSGLYPVSAQPGSRQAATSPTAPSRALPHHISHIHVRSASASDSTREHPTSPPPIPTNPRVGNLIRGSLYPPAAPFVDVIIPPIPQNRRQQPNLASASFDSGATHGSSDKSGVKTFMGSVRRALSGRYGGSHPESSREDSNSNTNSRHGKKSGLPSNTTKPSDNLRDHKLALGARRHRRIDILCAKVYQSYQMAQKNVPENQSTLEGSQNLAVSAVQDSEAPKISVSPGLSAGSGDEGVVLGGHRARYEPKASDSERQTHLQTTQVSSPGDLRGDGVISDGHLASSDVGPMSVLPARFYGHQGIPGSTDNRRSRSVDTALARRSGEVGQRQEVGGHNPLEGATGFSAASDPTGRTAHSSPTGPALLLSQRAKSAQASHAVPSKARLYVYGTSSDSSADESESDGRPQGPDHSLRRRPGGELRNIESVSDLTSRFRRQSTGSLKPQSDSVGSMLVMGGHGAPSSQQKQSIPYALQPPVSFIRTHSSQHIRPSFQAAVSGFTTIPDDGDGGLEETLLKLEGRYTRALPRAVSRPKVRSSQGSKVIGDRKRRTDQRHPSSHQREHGRPRQHRASSRPGQPRSRPPPPVSRRDYQASAWSASGKCGRSQTSVVYSEDSDQSIPLLERGLFDEPAIKPGGPAGRRPPMTMAHAVPDRDIDAWRRRHSSSSHSPVEIVAQTESLGEVGHDSTVNNSRRSFSANSFLLDENDHLTDLSSELSLDLADDANIEYHLPDSIAAPSRAAISSRKIPTHPLAHPPSPASSSHPALPSTSAGDASMFQQKPLTPQPSPTQGDTSQSSQGPLSQVSLQRKIGITETSPPITASAGHIPFVLACESIVLAQQLTLVEQAALSEIDWSDLVDMKWDSKSPKALNWVEYLATNDNRGIDLVIARFNIMVKWVISEIVMTQNLYERAHAMIKFIHIAAHTRKMHNYATMLQITIALTSIDCTRLKETWNEVPDREKAVLKELEALTLPNRNFSRLRMEMETANLQDGCIPFLGLYVHDLTYNSQKPSLINTGPDQEPLVNFERYRTIATIVKSLLRLIDASMRYTFSPVLGIIEPCLWLAALNDQKIAAMSRSIES